MVSELKLGVIGLSEGNGHPFSFSAIINGYDDVGFAASGWPVIHDYLKTKGPDEFGFDGVSVTHAWTQDADITKKLCAASKIQNACTDPADMLGAVDGVLIARDDWQTHYKLAKPFLDAGKYVFIDKPLSLSDEELAYFKPFLDSGMLMSCSGLRHAYELDDVPELGTIKCIHGTVLINWERYGVHLLDAAFTKTKARPVSVARNPAAHESFTIAMDDGSTFAVDAIGMGPKTFRLSFFGDKGRADVDMHDNFAAFRATLAKFIEMTKTGIPPIDPADTLCIMKTLQAGNRAKAGDGHVRL